MVHSVPRVEFVGIGVAGRRTIACSPGLHGAQQPVCSRQCSAIMAFGPKKLYVVWCFGCNAITALERDLLDGIIA